MVSGINPDGILRFGTEGRPRMAWMVAGSASIITTPGSKSSQSGGVLSGGVLFVYTQADKKFVINFFYFQM